MLPSQVCDIQLDAMATHLTDLKLTEKAAVTLDKPEPSYILNIDSQICSLCGKETTLAATDNCNVRLFSRGQLATKGLIKGHEEVVTGVRFGHRNHNCLFTASLDGTVRCWDIRTDLRKAVQKFEGGHKTNNNFSALDVNADDSLVCAGSEDHEDHEEVNLLLWDVRKSDLQTAYTDSHSSDITQVKFHPTKRASMASGSTDGLVCLFDVSQPTEDDAFLMTLNSESSVSQIGWCGKGMDDIYCQTHIETFHVWEGTEWDLTSEILDIREKYEDKIDYLVDCFTRKEEDTLYLVTSQKSGSVSIWQVDGNDLHLVTQLNQGHRDTVRCLTWDEDEETLVTGGEDSLLCLWKPGQDQQTEAEESKVKPKMKEKKALSKAKKKPY